MRFYAPYVSASVSGDYYQLYLGPDEDEEADPYDVTGPYLMVQKEFGLSRMHCYIESENQSYVGHFPLRLIEFSSTLLSFDILRANNNHVEVSFALDASLFEEVRRIAEVIYNLRDPDDSDAL